ncbi:lytic polysaccharide monooxygenase [Polychaeton citri CBS 116435]|uniref:Lytic polysaccharide monooxygenase n=1 Tax=Polychaeton citri CBS 116435 TaxID=1314669 RepID=A0A9P4ULX9_9PEZI|nr:lytic polysaccharide monooxygenase [Polychaeton citri CBS 116435]
MAMNAFRIGFAAIALIQSAKAHLVMNTPTPYDVAKVSTSPLNGEGINFPCQAGSTTDWDQASGDATQMKVGQKNPLKFTGSAAHGGGSCQLSVTYEFPPPADPAKWHVIHTYLGGCPTNAAGNLQTAGSDKYGRPDGPDCALGQEGECMNQYEFDLPEGIKNGKATLAWTWFNKIGNREMYMNCAPVEISGGSDSDDVVNTLPSMFVANIPGYCTTGEGNLNIPNPGKFVTNGETVDDAAIGTCSKGASTSSGNPSSYGSSGSGSGGAAAGSSSAASPQVTVTTMSTVTSGSSSPATSAAYPYPSSNAGGSDAAPTDAPSPSSSGYGSGSSSSSSNGSAASGTESSGDSVSCSTPGDVVCIGDGFWGMCNTDKVAVKMALADGTTCSNGVIAKAKARRHARDHMQRHKRGLLGVKSGGIGWF